MKKITASLLLALVLFTCERDDICSESITTSRINIALLDINFPDEDTPKNVFNLRVQGVGNESVLSDYDVVRTNNLLLPLKTTDDVTQFRLHINYAIDDNGTPEPEDDIIEGNEDIITINYTREQEYLSRGCGYRTIFKNVTITVEDDGNNWIQNILPANDNLIVNNEDEVHYKIYH
ncbi:DUF6452 family protein [Mangrovimonas spongiae]|uniref:Uncharacterized protein n=1 Tax=Mangrovimonas spongiae TaxID=2494697 RepID=A0A3R9NNW4_9FLAO|nr:DUF6452 family protein [Mangrovimonas spongiae]RSK38248.1 hypothetical protein EJA19_12185 [Mangrovimonas spongiae]